MKTCPTVYEYEFDGAITLRYNEWPVVINTGLTLHYVLKQRLNVVRQILRHLLVIVRHFSGYVSRAALRLTVHYGAVACIGVKLCSSVIP